VNPWTALRMVPPSLGLIIRAPGWAINYSMSYKRARRQFREHLIEQGVPPEEAYELADQYPFKMSDFWEVARNRN
jgi:hypothetical protein